MSAEPSSDAFSGSGDDMISMMDEKDIATGYVSIIVDQYPSKVRQSRSLARIPEHGP